MAFAREEAFRLLEKALAEGRLGHAYLISGSPGSGVQEFANEVAGLFLSAGAIHVEQDPDFHSIQPGSKSRRVRGVESPHDRPHAGARQGGRSGSICHTPRILRS